MVQKCVVVGCGSKWYPGCSLIFHSFPKDPSRRKQWLSSVKLKNQFYETAKICSKNFEPADYLMENRLKHTAVPSFSVMSSKSELEGNVSTVSVYNTPVRHETIFPLPSTSHCELADNLAMPEESIPTSKAYSILSPTAPAKIDLFGNISSNATEGDKVDLPPKKKICLREILVEKNEFTKKRIPEEGMVTKDRQRKDLARNDETINVCSLHFEDSAFNKTLNIGRLRDDAIQSCYASQSSNQSVSSGHCVVGICKL